MGRRGWSAVAVAAVVVVSGFVVDQHALAASPPAVSGSVSLQAARNTDPRAKQFLDDVKRGEYTWLSMPGTFVEATVHWHLPRRPPSDGACQLAVHVLPEAPRRLGTASTGTINGVAMGDDVMLKRAFDEPGPADSFGGISYVILPDAAEGTITFVVAYPDQQNVAFDAGAARASAVVICDNHDSLLGRTRQVVGPVAGLPVSRPS
ncbi:hypothetical protein ABH920_008543 [Catenulispora sp. EB89]|uniref:hypothetical protein n=1 Tax=Catenulispora sp. EB89 TaxID=3156257 RepID=UPI0035192CF0